MNLFVTTCIVLLVILATMHYLAKVKSDNLGPFFKWIGYLVLLAAVCVLLGMTYKGIKRVTRNGRGHSEHSIHMKHGEPGEKAKKRSHHKMMHNEGKSTSGCNDHQSMANNCCCCCEGEMGMMNMDDCCDGTMSESSVDTVDGKIIKKEIKIIRDEKEK